jgi:pyruvate/2-oxoglutarate dehydrogenase complex dihydrolipoamide dehydrogenase (E3) component
MSADRMAPSPPPAPPVIPPWDTYNQALVASVHPPDWVNPTPASRYHLVVIGAGTAGLVTAAGAAGLGAKVALVERHLMGGDCLNVGCVPSKTLIRSARALADACDAARFGVRGTNGAVADFAAVMERVRRVRADISPHDSARRFRELGVDVFLGHARFTGPDTVTVGPHMLRFKRAVIATGARAGVPEVPGLREAGFLTNETVFNLTELPRRLAVLGGGPIGCELAQAFARLGSEVHLLQRPERLLPREDAEASALVQRALERDGARLHLAATLRRVEPSTGGKRLHFEREGRADAVMVDAILVAAGRVPNVDGLGLETAGVRWDARRGVEVNDRLQTANPRVYAAGDVCLPWKFTHAADFAARLVIQNALFLGRKKLSALTVPWCTYTAPEVARVGLGEAEARERGVAVDTFTRQFRDVDRARTEGEEEGFVRIHVRRGTDRIVGATVVARHAGEMISEISVAMAAGMGLGRLATVIHPYPTQAEAIRQIGDAWNRTRLTPRARALLARWLKWTG